jgi:hypothetical protein
MGTMRRGRGFAPWLLVLALALPPLLNLIDEVRRIDRAGPAPEVASFGFGAPDETFVPPPGARRGRYVPGRIIDFRSPSAFRSTFLVHFSPKESVGVGAAVMTPGRILAGTVVKVWTRAGVALARSVEDPAFRAVVRAGEAEVVLAGRGEGAGLQCLGGAAPPPSEEPLATAGTDGVFPAGLLVGYRRTGGALTIEPAFRREAACWAYLWYDPDLEALEAALGPRAGW